MPNCLARCFYVTIVAHCVIPAWRIFLKAEYLEHYSLLYLQENQYFFLQVKKSPTVFSACIVCSQAFMYNPNGSIETKYSVVLDYTLFTFFSYSLSLSDIKSV